ncbi:DUF6233 domain-containing protein [Streptomyces mirabilis]|uniref:DUF6233 domain-containing protein n=1 Tax=Streptomyces mirabilis TaxID=68239 RepID=UPI0036ACF151
MSTLANTDFRALGSEIIDLVQRKGQEQTVTAGLRATSGAQAPAAGDPPRSTRRRAWRPPSQQARCRGEGRGTAGATSDIGVAGDAGPANGRPPIEVHVGGCYAAGKRRRPVPRDEAPAAHSGVRACTQCKPDAQLRILD